MVSSHRIDHSFPAQDPVTEPASSPAATNTLPQIPVSTLRPGMSVDSVYVLTSVEQRTKKNGDPYFSLQLADGTGVANAVMWDKHESLLARTIEREDYVHVLADAGDFNGQLQLNLRRIARADASRVNPKDFLAYSPRPMAEMEAELDAALAEVKNPQLARLLERLFRHKRFRELYCSAPAALRIHQAYIGGLLEHTLNVLRHVRACAPTYAPVNMDLAITGTLLHDVGKIRELAWGRVITYTDEGRLFGHITIGAQMIEGAIRELQRQPGGFDDTLRLQLIHMILSHHGKLEYGSPVTPRTREAMLLHYCDYMDAYLTMATAEMNRATAKGEAWTPYLKLFDAYLYAGPPANDPAAASVSPNAEFDSRFQEAGRRDPVDDIHTLTSPGATLA